MHVAALLAAGTLWTGQIGTVYTPPGYSTAHRYPVLYLLHGLPGGPEEFWNALHLRRRLDALPARFLVVTPAGPANGEWADAWERWFVDRVVPWVDSHYSTIRSPHGRALEGLSAGGYGAVDIGLRHPRLFGGLGAWDGYFTPLRDGPLAHATRAQLAAHDPRTLVREEAPVLRRQGTSFYVSAGGNHGAVRTSGSIAFAHELGTLHLPHELWLLPPADRGHFWGATVHSALQFAVNAFRS